MAKEMEITDDYLQAVIDGDVAKMEAHERGKKDVEIGFGWSVFEGPSIKWTSSMYFHFFSLKTRSFAKQSRK